LGIGRHELLGRLGRGVSRAIDRFKVLLMVCRLSGERRVTKVGTSISRPPPPPKKKKCTARTSTSFKGRAAAFPNSKASSFLLHRNIYMYASSFYSATVDPLISPNRSDGNRRR
jgi:hypothetical protein